MPPRIPNLTLRPIAIQVNEILDLPITHPTGMKVVRTVISTMTKALHEGEEIDIRGFGILRVVKYKARKTGSNFMTNSKYGDRCPVAIQHPDKLVVTFLPSVQTEAVLNHTGPMTYIERRATKCWGDDTGATEC